MKSIIDSQHLRIFVTLARHLNMSRAAGELQLTPSALSHALKTLEKDLGCRLFDRNSHKMVLSPSGQELVPEAVEILERMALLRQRAQVRSGSAKDLLRIGCGMTASQAILPRVVQRFREDFPDVTVHLEAHPAPEVIQLLVNDQLDLALLVEPASRPELKFDLLAEDDLQAVMTPRHPWAQKGKVEWKDMLQQKFIVRERSSESYPLIENYFRGAGLALQPFAELTSDEAIKNFVSLDLGIGILPRWSVATEIENRTLVVLPFGKTLIVRRWGLVRNQARELRPAEKHFTLICREILEGLIATPA